MFFGLLRILSAFSREVLQGFFLIESFMSAKFDFKQAAVLISHYHRLRCNHSNLWLRIFSRFSRRCFTSLGWSSSFFLYRGRVWVFIREPLEYNVDFKFYLRTFFTYFVYYLILVLFFIFGLRLGSLRIRLLSFGINLNLFFSLILGELQMHQISFELWVILDKLGLQ